MVLIKITVAKVSAGKKKSKKKKKRRPLFFNNGWIQHFLFKKRNGKENFGFGLFITLLEEPILSSKISCKPLTVLKNVQALTLSNKTLSRYAQMFTKKEEAKD